MNSLGFLSKTLMVYSLRRNNERIDLSSLPDDIFDKVLIEFSTTQMCKEGNFYTGKFVMEMAKAMPYITMLEIEIAPKHPRIKQLIAYLKALQDGDVFRIVSEDAPTMNKQLAVLKTEGQKKGISERIIHYDYLIRWGGLTTRYYHFAYGYDGIRIAVGEGDKTKRICRFCGGKMPDVKYRAVAHAISEGLGNKILFCNEECDDCNNKFSKLESNLMHYLDIRRAMGGILTKSDGTVPSVDGKGFAIRGDVNNQAVLYLEEGMLTRDKDLTKPFQVTLETYDSITHQGIFKTLCKIVIDLLHIGELGHFRETIGWINGSVLDNELPPYWATYGRESVKQPTVDYFLSKNPGTEPYCTAIVHVLDAYFVFILPEVDVDKGRFKTVQSIVAHCGKFMRPYGGHWHVEDSSEYELSIPWSKWLVKPGDAQVQIRHKDDPVFMRYKKEESERNERLFPLFDPVGISNATISNVHFERHSLMHITREELYQVSVNFNTMRCLLDRASSSARFLLDLNFSDSSNRLSFFDFQFEAEVRFTDFDRYIEMDECFCIDYHLRDYLINLVMDAGDKELHNHTTGTDLEPFSLKTIIDSRIIRQLYYMIPVGDGRFFVVKDAKLHN